MASATAASQPRLARSLSLHAMIRVTLSIIVYFRVNSAWLIGAGAAIGWFVS